MADDVAWHPFDCSGVLWTQFGEGEGVNLSDELWLLHHCAGGDELHCCVASDELMFLPSCLTGNDWRGDGGCVLSS